MNKKKKRGVFIIVFSSIILCVALVGTSFSYFTARMTGETEVEVKSYQLATTMTITQTLPSSDKSLIPLDDSLIEAAVSSSHNCIDDNGYAVCKVYRISITNTGEAISLSGKLEMTENGFTNLKYVLLDSNGDIVNDSEGEAISTYVENADNTENFSFEGSSSSFTIADGSTTSQTKTYDLVIWLSNVDPEVGAETNPQDAEQGQSFSANVIFEAAGGNYQLKGVINS